MRRPFQKLSKERQAEILEAAISVFAERGYYDANVDSICKEANIANGSLYRYFGNKENLCVSAYNYAIEMMFEAAYNIDRRDEKSVFEIVRDVLHNTQKFYLARQNLFLFYANIWTPAMNHFVPKIFIQSENDIDNFWIELIKRGQARGEIDKAFAPESAAYLIDSQTLLFLFSLGSIYHKKRFDSFLQPNEANQTFEEVIEKIINTLQFCLAPRDTPGKSPGL